MENNETKLTRYTKEGFEALQSELKDLKQNKLEEVKKSLAQARSF